MKSLRLYLLEQWLIWRLVYGDQAVIRRLRALTRLRTRYRLREYRELLELGERLGMRDRVAEAIYRSLAAEIEERLEAMR